MGELWVTPIQVEHTIPTAGFIVHDGETGFVFSGDTGPTTKLWKAAKEMRGLKAVIVETSFPNRMDGLAKASGHLTPAMLQRELDKAPPDVPVWVYHVKPQLYSGDRRRAREDRLHPHPHPRAGQDVHAVVAYCSVVFLFLRWAGAGSRGALVRSNLLASRATSLGHIRLPPHPPEAGGALAARFAGRLARRMRPALRGALRLVGFAPDGTPASGP